MVHRVDDEKVVILNVCPNHFQQSVKTLDAYTKESNLNVVHRHFKNAAALVCNEKSIQNETEFLDVIEFI